MNKKSLFTTVGGLILLTVFLIYEASLAPDRELLVDERVASRDMGEHDDTLMPSMPVIISDQRVQHILYGDHKGGGHKHGVGKPCKSEFPQGWDDERIIDVTRQIAANDNLSWERQRNGYYVAEAYEDDIRVRVVKGRQKQRVITAYPVNVQRNPCPANDF